MAKARQVIRQRDFSGGHMVAHAKRRDDEAVVRAGARDLTNSHILSTGAVENRPGRSALYSSAGRTDQIRMSPTATFDLCFGENTLTIRNHATGAIVATQGLYSWVTSTTNLITWDVFGNEIFITYPTQIPKVARWDGVSTWTFADFTPLTTISGQKRVPFYRFAAPGITMLPSATTGAITVTFSSSVLVAGHIGTVMRFCDRQMVITGVTSGVLGAATVMEPLPAGQTLLFTVDPTSTYTVGDVIQGVTSNAKAYVTSVSAAGVNVQLLNAGIGSTQTIGGQGQGGRGGDDEPLGGVSTGLGFGLGGTISGFSLGEKVVGPSGSNTIGGTAGVSIVNTVPRAVPVWDEEVMNSYRGWPRSVSVDQSRLIFCDFPSVAHGVAWSGLAIPTDLYVGAEADAGFFELVPLKSRVYHVVPGSDEFVITDRGPYYIPISTSNPLRPGSVDFRRIPGPPGSTVRPVSTAQGVAYVTEALDAIAAIVGTGQSAQPYLARPVSDLHSDLFVGVTCLAVADDPENLVYAVNGTGTMAVGRYQPGKEWVGWLPWDGEGFVYWANALGDSVYLSTTYGTTTLVELVTATQYLDAAVLVNSVPAAFSGGGTGPLWFFTGTEVDLMDGLKYLGRRTVTLGAIVTLPNDDFSAVTVKAGYGWTQAVEPFIGHAQGGQSVKQTIDARETFNIAVAVQQSTGFTMWQYSFKTETWTQLKDNASAYRTGDNQDVAPRQREEVVLFKAAGTEHDPRYQLRKTTPGTLKVLEISDELGA